METFGRAPAARYSRKVPSPWAIGTRARIASARRRALTLLECAMVLGLFAFVIGGMLYFMDKARMEREGGSVVATHVSAAQAPSVSVTIPEPPVRQAHEASSPARDTSMSAEADRLSAGVSSVGKLMLAGAVVAGIVLLGTGLVKLKRAAEWDEQVSSSEGAWRLAVGAALVGLPAVAGAISSTPDTAPFRSVDSRTEYASVPAKTPNVASVDIGLHDLAQRLEAMQLSETCPGTDFASQSCGTVGDYLVRRDMDGTISVSLLTRTAGGRPVANEVLRVVGQEPYLSNEIAASDLDAVKKQLIRTFLAR